jgi:hypothetical protein
MIGCDAHAISGNPNLNATTFIPNSGSPVISAGKNLNSVCTGQAMPGLGALCSDAAGIVRPTSAAWDIGAFQFASPPPISSGPSSLAVGSFIGLVH